MTERPVFNTGPRDWPEDEQYENGSYTNRCHRCGDTFTGLKRRITCKLCDAAPIPPLINGLTRSETDASASVAGVSAASEPLEPHFVDQATGEVSYSVGQWGDAQSRIASLTDALDVARAERDCYIERLVDAREQADHFRAELNKANTSIIELSTSQERLPADLGEARAERDAALVKRDVNLAGARRLEQERAEQWNKARDLKASLDVAKAAATAPRVPLTDEVIMELAGAPDTSNAFEEDQDRREMVGFARAIEAAHGISAIPGDDAKAAGGEAQA